MTAQTALFLAGLLQIGGIVVTFCGAVRTWNTFSPNERILDSTRTRIGRVSATIHRRIKHHHRTLEDKIAVTDEMGPVRKQFGCLDPEAEVWSALSDLDSRTREIMDLLHDVCNSLTDQQSELKGRLAALERDVVVRVADLEQRDQRVATGGIKTILLGLGFVGMAVFVQTLAVFFPAA